MAYLKRLARNQNNKGSQEIKIIKARKKSKLLASLFCILYLNLLISRHKQNESVHTLYSTAVAPCPATNGQPGFW